MGDFFNVSMPALPLLRLNAANRAQFFPRDWRTRIIFFARTTHPILFDQPVREPMARILARLDRDPIFRIDFAEAVKVCKRFPLG